jgi:hypothetical protein
MNTDMLPRPLTSIRLKGANNTAQGNALGIPHVRLQALKGRNLPCHSKRNSQRGICGAGGGGSYRALSRLGTMWRAYSQGVALGWIMNAFQASSNTVLSAFQAGLSTTTNTSYLCPSVSICG